MEKLLGFLIVIFSLTLNTSAYAHEHGMMGPGMMGWGFGMGWPGIIFMFIFWIAVFIAFIFLIRWLVLSTGQRGERHPEETALDILKKRYARGEIKKEEFEEKKKDLEK